MYLPVRVVQSALSNQNILLYFPSNPSSARLVTTWKRLKTVVWRRTPDMSNLYSTRIRSWGSVGPSFPTRDRHGWSNGLCHNFDLSRGVTSGRARLHHLPQVNSYSTLDRRIWTDWKLRACEYEGEKSGGWVEFHYRRHVRSVRRTQYFFLSLVFLSCR